MEIFTKSPATPAPLLTISHQDVADNLSFLKPGAVLSARIATTAADGTISLEINGRLLKVVSELKLAQGATINIRVEQQKGEPVLRLLTPQPNSPSAPMQALRHVLPRQQPLQVVFQQLARVIAEPEMSEKAAQQSSGSRINTAQSAESRTNTTQAGTTPAPLPRPSSSSSSIGTLPAALRQEIITLMKQLPDQKAVSSPEALQQSITRSGNFFEHLLLQRDGNTALQTDTKTILFRIAYLLRQAQSSLNIPPPLTQQPERKASTTTSARQQHTLQSNSPASTSKQLEMQPLLQQLSRLTDSALARIQTNQLTTLNSQQSAEEPVLTLELPLFNGKDSETVEITIQRQIKQRGTEGEPCWSVSLKLDSGDYGQVRAIVSLIGQKVSTTFWCAQADTQNLFQQHLEELRTRITEQGLTPGRTQALTGLPPEPDGPNRPGDDNLIHIQA